jgi:mRNA-degrading endonuclease HigB of HigAB toxin-antitoxin module
MKKYNWPQIIEEQKVSGKTVKAFCAEKGFHENTFYKYRAKHKKNKHSIPASFIKIEPGKEVLFENNKIIIDVGKYKIKLSAGFSSDHFTRVLDILEKRI